jgi:hypothetical protein
VEQKQDAPVTTQTTEPAGPINPLDAILNLASSGLGAQIKMANDIIANPKAVAVFAQIISDADGIAELKFSFGNAQTGERQEWQRLTLAGIEGKLKTWAENGDASAKKVLANLAAFKASEVDVTGPLWQVVTEIMRPAMAVRSYFELEQLLEKFVDQGLVDRFEGKRLRFVPTPEKVVRLHKGKMGYLPAMHGGKVNPMCDAGWPSIKDAEKRAQDRFENRAPLIADMRKSDSGLTSDDVRNGKKGTIFLSTGDNSAVLLLVKADQVRVLKAIGLKASEGHWLNWDADEASFQDARIFRAFNIWRKG